MNCPVCKSYNIYVTGTNNKPETYTHRYEHCLDCGTTFQTAEEVIPGSIKENFYEKFQPSLFVNPTAKTNGHKKA